MKRGKAREWWQQMVEKVFEDARFEQRAESSEGVPTCPFHGRASRHKEQQGKRMLVLEGQPGGQSGWSSEGLRGQRPA